jgi:hypothetical protein
MFFQLFLAPPIAKHSPQKHEVGCTKNFQKMTVGSKLRRFIAANINPFCVAAVE